MDKVLIAMSGGVDSSVAAFLMKEQGCECIGATMKLFHNEDIGVSRTKTCCSLEDVEDARLVALHLGIPYYVFNFSDDFKGQVIDRFISSYERGATPNPCIDCNRYLKFERLYERARILGCDAIVTGHYARIEQENGRWLLKKSLNESKDQSYVLYSLTQDQLAHTRLPLGAMHKSETRRIAEEQGFYNADKPDSQDICFVPDGDYAGFIARYTGRDCPAGDFVDESGRVLGRHKGIVHYTVGQRKGLGIAADAPLYVKRIDAAPRFGMNEVNAAASQVVMLVVPELSAAQPLVRSVGSAMSMRYYYGIDTGLKGEKQDAANDELIDTVCRGTSLQCSYDFFNVESRESSRADYYSIYGGLFYLGVLLCVVFVCATVLIIYYKQVCEGYEDQARFDIMQKIGMTRREIRRSVNSQLLTVFFLPLLGAGLHLAFAFPMLRRLLMLFELQNVALFAWASVVTFAVFAVFYSIVYRVTSAAYYSIVSNQK